MPSETAPDPRGDRLALQVSALHVSVLLAAIAACYANGLSGPFLLDDPAPGMPLGTASRRLVVWSFELNRWLSGPATWSYHLFNVLAHAATALLLLGVLRRALELAEPDRSARSRGHFALAVSLLWAVHPLATSAVTYLSQRAEVLASACILATLYGAFRARLEPGRHRWPALSLASVALGFGIKETAAAAPILVWLAELTLAREKPLDGFRRRWRFHLALLALSALLALRFILPLLFAEDASAGFRMEEGVGPLIYARSQAGVILHYLRLVVWPDPLVFDYAWPAARSAGEWVPHSVALAVLLAVAAGLVARRSPLGLPAAGFFVLLAPSSSIVPIRDLAFEHRMYLPLACVLTGVALAVRAVCARAFRVPARAPATLAGIAALALGAATVQRNREYATALALWHDTVEQAPHNPRAHNNLAAALIDLARTEEAERELRAALELDPQHANAQRNLGVIAAGRGNYDAAIWHFRRALELAESPIMREDLARLYALTGRPAESEEELVRAVEVRRERARDYDDPRLGPSQLELARLLVARGAHETALPYLVEAVALPPAEAEEHALLGRCLAAAGRAAEAQEELRAALRLEQSSPEARAAIEALRSALEHAPEPVAPIPR